MAYSSRVSVTGHSKRWLLNLLVVGREWGVGGGRWREMFKQAHIVRDEGTVQYSVQWS